MIWGTGDSMNRPDPDAVYHRMQEVASPHEKVLMLMYLMYRMGELTGNTSSGTEEISNYLGLPENIVEQIMDDLTERGLIEVATQDEE
jgi:DNA-binding MarR family transcriptional regulator